MEEIIRKPKKNNHIYPRLHIKKWKLCKGKVYDKAIGISREIKKQDFSLKYYYSLGQKNDDLENRIVKFETYISELIVKIDNAENSIYLTGKEIELLKLYVVLCACRQHNTSEVIRSDEAGSYRSNNYIFGIPRIEKQDDAVSLTSKIIDDFEKIKNFPCDKEYKNWDGMFNDAPSVFTLGQHLCILRSIENAISVSNICAIIENTLDSDYLYTYVPVSPKSALVLAKSKYYKDNETYEKTKYRLGMKNGWKPDPYLSVIFGQHNCENELFCSYYKIKSSVHIKPTEIVNKTYQNAFVKISNLPIQVVRELNSIFYEDGEKYLYLDENELEFIQTHKLACRDIKLSGWWE